MDILEIELLAKKYFLFIYIYLVLSIGISVWLIGKYPPIGGISLLASLFSPLLFQRAFCGPFVSKGQLTIDDQYIIVESFDKRTGDLIFTLEFQYKDIKKIAPPRSSKSLNNRLMIAPREGKKWNFDMPGYLDIVLIFNTITKHVKTFNGKATDDQKVKIGYQ